MFLIIQFIYKFLPFLTGFYKIVIGVLNLLMNPLSEKVAPQAELHGEPYLIGAIFIVVNQVEDNRC